MKMKQVNNSNFVPSMHSRYVTDESQLYWAIYLNINGN
jgi:hypothetical protein